ncbi:hypothetical protein NHQ30_003619 [Ciborinia camelliae]|nr:hypothetical protein NHQ30_003619 [Ciborinia camelliae]
MKRPALDMSDSSKQGITSSASHLEPNGFIIFLELPLEIRLHIWNLAIPQGRILPFQIWSLKSEENAENSSFLHRLPAPKLMHVCREARKEVLKSFRKESYDSNTGGGIHDGDWWNPSRDTIYIQPPFLHRGISTWWIAPGRRSFSFIACADPERLERLKKAHHLAWSFNSVWLRWVSTRSKSERWIWNVLARWLHEFSSLKTFTWVVDGHANQVDRNPVWSKYPDVPVYGIKVHREQDSGLMNMTPSKINANLQEAFEVIKSENPGWNSPEVRFVFDASLF